MIFGLKEKSPKAPSEVKNRSGSEPSSESKEMKRNTSFSKITIKHDVGFNNFITIRGKGANLSWDQGITLKNTAPDTWVWESNAPFTAIEFKILINDNQWENGENKTLKNGSTLEYTPYF